MVNELRLGLFFFFSSRRRHTRLQGDWSSDVCSSDLAGAIESAYEFHWKRFLFDHFPKGTQFPALQAPQPPADLPLAEVQAFSIDDSATTEIDDALSVRGLGDRKSTRLNSSHLVISYA